tara:strand:- start:49 stop:936 length:888 start_codon:yes stop_codon:yes gene_type:complete
MENFANTFRNKKKFLIFGGGFSGQYFANEIRKIGHIALSSYRNTKKHNNDFLFNSESNDIPPNHIFEGTTHILSCIPPSKDGSDPVLSKLKKKLENLNLEWAGYLSTTGVYGNTFGEWVSEKDPTNPQQERSKRRLHCEKEWQKTNLPSQIFRLPGIYGSGRSTLESILKKNIRIIDKPDQVFSRIHVADIANAIIYILKNQRNLNFHKIINIADNNPSSQIEVIKYSYKILNLKMPDPITFNTAKKDLSPIALSFWQENRRVSNKLLCEELGYKLIHKDFKSGLKSCLKNLQFS